MLKLANTARHPVTLDDGTILAASGTEGSIKEVDSISDADRRYIDGGIIAVLDAAQAMPATVPAPATTLPASITSHEATDAASGNRKGGVK